MDIVSLGKVSKASVDATNLAHKVGAADQALRAGDVATAVSLLSSVTAANYPNLIGLSQLSGIAASVSIGDAYARYAEALRTGDNYGAIDAGLSMLGATGSLIAAISPFPQTKAIGGAIAISALAARELLKRQESIEDCITDMATNSERLQTPFVFLGPTSLIDAGLLDPRTLLPTVISPTLGTTPDPLVKTIVYVDPLVLDLDGDGLEITPLSKGILFDANGDAVKTGTAWVGADDGLLVWDRNGNGTIDTGAELFGDETRLANGQKAAHGFEALSELDTGSVVDGITVGAGDGVFDAKDAQYNTLRIWRDLNQDGISQANELQTLAQINFAREFEPIAVSDAAKALPGLKGNRRRVCLKSGSLNMMSSFQRISY